jgi:hypothetical protein
MPEICTTVISLVIAVALISAFAILFIGKIGLRSKIIERAPVLISKLFDCDFCLSFWASAILAIILAIVFSNILLIFIPIFSTPITRVLI